MLKELLGNCFNGMLMTQIIRVQSKTQFYFLFSFCLAKKKQKLKAKDQLLFFIAQKASAAPPKK